MSWRLATALHRDEERMLSPFEVLLDSTAYSQPAQETHLRRWAVREESTSPVFGNRVDHAHAPATH